MDKETCFGRRTRASPHHLFGSRREAEIPFGERDGGEGDDVEAEVGALFHVVEAGVEVVVDALDGAFVWAVVARGALPETHDVGFGLDEIEGGEAPAFFGGDAGAFEDEADGDGHGDYGGGLHGEGLVEPEEVGGYGAEDDGAGLEFERGDGEALDEAGGALCDEPEGLETGDCFCEFVAFAFVEDLLFGYVWEFDVAVLDEVVDLLRADGKGFRIPGVQDEAATIGIEAVHNCPAFFVGYKRLHVLYRALG